MSIPSFALIVFLTLSFICTFALIIAAMMSSQISSREERQEKIDKALDHLGLQPSEQEPASKKVTQPALTTIQSLGAKLDGIVPRVEAKQ